MRQIHDSIRASLAKSSIIGLPPHKAQHGVHLASVFLTRLSLFASNNILSEGETVIPPNIIGNVFRNAFGAVRAG